MLSTDASPAYVVVKNTFINVDDDSDHDRPVRRLVTVPSSWRPLQMDEDCCSRRPSIDASSDASTDASEEFVNTASTKSKRLSDALCLEKRALACPPAPHLAHRQIYSSSSALVRSGLAPRCAPAPLVLPKPCLSWASCTSSECGDESDDESDASSEPLVAAATSKMSELEVTLPVSRTLSKKKSVTFADTAEVIAFPTLQTVMLTAATDFPPPPAPEFPRSPLTANSKAFVPQKSLPARPSNTDTKTSSQKQIALNIDAVAMAPLEKYKALIDHVHHELMARKDCVVDATVVAGARGWTVTAYVKPEQLKLQEESLKETAQQAMLDAAQKSEIVYVLGHKTRPFASMPLGFGCALAVMPDPENACWGSYSKGFCRSPGSCKLQHPKDQTGVNVMFKPARVR